MPDVALSPTLTLTLALTLTLICSYAHAHARTRTCTRTRTRTHTHTFTLSLSLFFARVSLSFLLFYIQVVTRQIESYTQALVELGRENKGGAPDPTTEGDTLDYVCDAEGCSEKVAEAGGLCNLHYGLDAYCTFYEEGFLQNSRQFYMEESKTFLASNSVAEYMKKVEVRMREEKHRVESYMHETTWTALEKLLIQVLVADHMDEYKP